MSHKYITLLVILFFIHLTGQTQSGIDFKDIPLAALRNQAEQEQKLYFVYLHADWCLPCKWMEENSFQSLKVAHYSNRNYLALRLDVNNKQGKYYQKKWQASILPSILIFSPQGVEVSRQEGSIDEDQLFDFLRTTNKKWSAHSPKPASTTEQEVMDSPKPVLVISRPALQTEQSAQSSSAPPTSKKETPHQTKKIKTRQKPVISFSPPPKSKVFTPRSGNYYSISLGIVNDYEKALETVEKYDNKYGERVDMIPFTKDNTTQYQIISGHFARRSEAAQYLNYLNRNDIMGQIIKSSE